MILKIPFFLLLTVLIFAGCKSENPDDLGDGKEQKDSGQDPITPTPEPDPDDDDVVEPKPPPVERVSYRLDHHDFSNQQREKENYPYKTYYAKIANVGDHQRHKDCDYRLYQKCLVNRQVLFQFFTDKLNQLYPREIWAT